MELIDGVRWGLFFSEGGSHSVVWASPELRMSLADFTSSAFSMLGLQSVSHNAVSV